MVMFKVCNPENDRAEFVALTSDDKKIGECKFTYNTLEMRYTEISCDDDSVKEGLLRSSMNYCANRGVFLATVEEEMLCPATERLGFKTDNFTVEIPEALTSSCCSCNK